MILHYDIQISRDTTKLPHPPRLNFKT